MQNDLLGPGAGFGVKAFPAKRTGVSQPKADRPAVVFSRFEIFVPARTPPSDTFILRGNEFDHPWVGRCQKNQSELPGLLTAQDVLQSLDLSLSAFDLIDAAEAEGCRRETLLLDLLLKGFLSLLELGLDQKIKRSLRFCLLPPFHNDEENPLATHLRREGLHL